MPDGIGSIITLIRGFNSFVCKWKNIRYAYSRADAAIELLEKLGVTLGHNSRKAG